MVGDAPTEAGSLFPRHDVTLSVRSQVARKVAIMPQRAMARGGPAVPLQDRGQRLLAQGVPRAEHTSGWPGVKEEHFNAHVRQYLRFLSCFLLPRLLGL